jgi:hypothetical protein
MGFLISVVGVESLPNHLLTHTNAQHTTTAAFFFKRPAKAKGFGNSVQHLQRT